MNRRRCVGALGLAGLLGASSATACAPKQWARPAAAPVVGAGALLVEQPASQIGLALADLPAGFRLRAESSPPLVQTGDGDPWGRKSAYAATYAVESVAASTALSEVVSSVHAYASAASAKTAFQEWQAALPDTYRPVAAPPNAPLGALVFVQQNAARPVCFVGLQQRNVLSSVWVRAVPQSAVPLDDALRLAGIISRRIDSLAG